MSRYYVDSHGNVWNPGFIKGACTCPTANGKDLDMWEKIQKYRAGAYEFPPPPVYCGNWEEIDWINYVNRDGRWL